MKHKINCDFGKEKNGNVKLTLDQVESIRDLHIDLGLTQRALAAQFGICKTQVHRIIHNLSWA